MLQGINITLKSQLSQRHAAVAQGISKKQVKPKQNLTIRVLTSCMTRGPGLVLLYLHGLLFEKMRESAFRLWLFLPLKDMGGRGTTVGCGVVVIN